MIVVTKAGIRYKQWANSQLENVDSLGMYLGEVVEVEPGALIDIVIDDIMHNATIYNVIFNRELGGVDIASYRTEWEQKQEGRFRLRNQSKGIDVYWKVAYHPVVSPYTIFTPFVRSIEYDTPKKGKRVEPLLFASLTLVRGTPLVLNTRMGFVHEGKEAFVTHQLFTVYDLIRAILLTLCIHGTPEEREAKLLQIDKDMYIQADYTPKDFEQMGIL